MGPTWVLSAPDGPHIGPMNLAIRVDVSTAATPPYSPQSLSRTSTHPTMFTQRPRSWSWMTDTHPLCFVSVHSKNKVVKWTTLGLSNWCQKRTPQSRPKLVIWVSRRMTTLMSSQKQPENRQMATFLLVSLSYDDLVITLERLNDKPQIVKWWSCD